MRRRPGRSWALHQNYSEIDFALVGLLAGSLLNLLSIRGYPLVVFPLALFPLGISKSSPPLPINACSNRENVVRLPITQSCMLGIRFTRSSGPRRLGRLSWI